jgi:hypothetical protein
VTLEERPYQASWLVGTQLARRQGKIHESVRRLPCCARDGHTPKRKSRSGERLSCEYWIRSSAVAIAAMVSVMMSAMRRRLIPGTVPIAPAGRRTPVAPSPCPTAVAPSPAAADPDVTGRGADRHYLNHGGRHRGWDHHRGWGHENGGRGHYDRRWRRSSNSDTYNDASLRRGYGQGCQGQDCDCLFHIC